jgi:hypothetical protein
MSVRLQISLLIFMIVQAVLFGLGTVLVLATPMSADAMRLMPWVIGVSFLVSAPVSWLLAPHLRARFSQARVRAGSGAIR